MPDWTLTEGAKFDDDKSRVDLFPPNVIKSVGEVLKHGAKKYDDRNWEKGIRFGRVYAALLRHLGAWWEAFLETGEDFDLDSALHHLYHAGCNMAFLIHYINHYDDYEAFDDRPRPMSTTLDNSGP